MTVNNSRIGFSLNALEKYQLGELTFLADSMSYKEVDRVLPIFPDEQPLICDFLRLNGGENVIDAGTGSGVLAIYAAKQGCEVIGVDLMPRAINVAKENAKLNNVNGNWKCEGYSRKTAREKSTEVIVFNPPHHPTPPGVKVAKHADGGQDGLAVCNEFLWTSSYHINPGGRIVLFQLTPSNCGRQKVFEPLKRIFPKGYRVRFIKVLPTVSNEWFLNEVYQGAYLDWIKKMTNTYQDLDLILAEIVSGGDNLIEEIANCFKLSMSWKDRVNLHREILASHSDPRNRNLLSQ